MLSAAKEPKAARQHQASKAWVFMRPIHFSTTAREIKSNTAPPHTISLPLPTRIRAIRKLFVRDAESTGEASVAAKIASIRTMDSPNTCLTPAASLCPSQSAGLRFQALPGACRTPIQSSPSPGLVSDEDGNQGWAYGFGEHVDRVHAPSLNQTAHNECVAPIPR